MGSKVNPRVFRRTTTYQIPSRWFASKQDFPRHLQLDVEVRKMLRRKFKDGGVARIEIERSLGSLNITIHTSKPGVVIGRGGALIEETKKELKRRFFGSQKMKVNMTIQEVANPEMNAELIFQSIRDQIEQRVPFRRALKRSMELVMRAGAKGCRLQISGRLNGAEIARRETMSQGRLPLHTLRAHIDYTRGIAQTMYGVIGIKVWIYKGDVFEGEEVVEQVVEKKRPAQPVRRRKMQSTGNGQILRKKADVDADTKRSTETVTA